MRKKIYCLLICILAVIFLFCSNDYNPFESYLNANVYILPEACSQKLKNHDTLNIFSTETLAVFTCVREKIDSFKIFVPFNRYWVDTTIKQPLSVENYIFLISFFDTGNSFVKIITYKTNNTISETDLPLYITSSLKQKDFYKILGQPCTLYTEPVADNFVFYVWALGKDTIKTTINYKENPKFYNQEIGKIQTGYLWVTDWEEKTTSPKSPFVFEFFKPSAPIIECISAGLRNKDSVVTGEDNLAFTVRVIDSSGLGLASVELIGDEFSTNDSIVYWKVFTGMKSYMANNPKVAIVKATNKLGDITTDTFYLFYEQGAPATDIVKINLVNPTTSLTTRLSQIPVIVSVTNMSHDSVTMVAYKDNQIIAKKSIYDSIGIFGANISLVNGQNIIKISAYVAGKLCADTSIIITKDPNYIDKTPPVIYAIFINGSLYNIEPFPVSGNNLKIAISTFDNESGISSVTATAKISNMNEINIPFTYQANDFLWVSENITLPIIAGRITQIPISITIRNNSGLITTKSISLERKANITTGQ
jgi:hypothetical protein